VTTGERKFNCFAFALGLHESENYFRIAAFSAEPNVFADTPFVHRLIESHILNRAERREIGTQLVIYFHDGEVTHAGFSSADRITSKWGTGQYFEHSLFEVPANYGNKITYFEVPEIEKVEHAFFCYAAAQGVAVDDFVSAWCST
jgi:hypothetical protein